MHNHATSSFRSGGQPRVLAGDMSSGGTPPPLPPPSRALLLSEQAQEAAGRRPSKSRMALCRPWLHCPSTSRGNTKLKLT